MTKAEINPGICGFNAEVSAVMEGRMCSIEIKCDCEAIQQLAAELSPVKPVNEISFKRNTPQIIELGMKYCFHAACPVPAGIIKALEVEAGLALPADVSIALTKG